MIIHVKEIPEEGLERSFSLEKAQLRWAEWAGTPGEPELASAVRVQLKAQRLRRNVQLSGQIDCLVSLVCSRCVKRYALPLEFPVRRLFCPYPTREEGEKELSLEDMEVSFYKGEEIDPVPAIEEELLLFLPFRPLCKDSCQGLCVSCGADLNLGPCSCAVREESPALAHFSDFVVKNKER